MDETTKLMLLMGDGPVSIVADGILTPEQYADLNAVAAETRRIDDLKTKVEGLAVAWGVNVTVERVKKPKDHNGQ